GITPLRALLEELDYAPGEATLVYRARSAADLVLRPELEQLAQERGVQVHYLTGPRRPGQSWLPVGAQGWDDATALATLVGALADTDVYVCGPDPWTDAVRTAALRAGLPPAQLHEERFAW
ncbi:MAG: oxidoreductase, partial [Frankiales bacterium]|nr:oxidoreductase [Frankiales bacterium]